RKSNGSGTSKWPSLADSLSGRAQRRLTTRFNSPPESETSIKLTNKHFKIHKEIEFMAKQNKFPYLKSTSDPMGLLEQLSVAITLRPLHDGAAAAIPTWFGRLLSESASFVWSYEGSHDSFQYDRAQVAEAYFSNQLRYTAFDWDTSSQVS